METLRPIEPFCSTSQPLLHFAASTGLDMSPEDGKSRLSTKRQVSPRKFAPLFEAPSPSGSPRSGGKVYRGQLIPPTPHDATLEDPFLVAVPLSPASSSGLVKSNPSLDVEMHDAYATPPTTRILSTISHLASPPDTIPRPSFKQGGSIPAPIQTSTLLSVVAPLTPPLTPPFSSAGIKPLAREPSSPMDFPTQSARLLYNHPLHPIFEAEYTIHEELGCGGFGFVVRATRNRDGLSVAVKFIEREKIPNHGWATTHDHTWPWTRGLRRLADPRDPRMIPMEAYVLSAIRHEGVVAFIELFEDDKYFYLIMEHHGSPWQSQTKASKPSPPPSPRPVLGASLSFTVIPKHQIDTPVSSPILASATLPSPKLSPPRPAPMMRRSSCDLFECIEQHSRFTEEMARYVFAQIVEVVYFLGKMGVCHRDIKDENIVISRDLKVKLIDFGSAVIFDPRQPLPVYDRFYGTTAFASSEILRNQKYQAPSSEVWSLGVLLSILITGECPFADAKAAAAGRITPPRIHIGFEVEMLMRACLQVDVSKRITIEQIRGHRWLRGALQERPVMQASLRHHD